MKSYNNVTLVGRAAGDVDFKEGKGDIVARASFTVEVDRQKEAKKQVSDFLQIVAYGRLAEICSDYITKGSLILISGRLRSRSYEIDNETRWITEVIAESINVLEYKESNK
jgi:single-strand DNA-binding protein